jgi:hypothetical protein
VADVPIPVNGVREVARPSVNAGNSYGAFAPDTSLPSAIEGLPTPHAARMSQLRKSSLTPSQLSRLPPGLANPEVTADCWFESLRGL